MLRILITVFFCFNILNVFSQNEQFDRSTYYSYGVKLFSEAHILPDAQADSLKVTILFKISYDAIQFVQKNPLENQGSYQGIATTEIYFKDSNGIIKNRNLWSDTIWISDYNETKSKVEYVYGMIETKLAKGNYDCSVILLDRFKIASEKNEIDINADKDFSNKPQIGSPIFTFKDAKQNENLYNLYVLGNKIEFTPNNSFIFIPVSFKDTYNTFNFNIIKKINIENQIWNDSVNISGRTKPKENSIIQFEQKSNNNISLKLIENYSDIIGTSTNKLGTLAIEVPSVLLSPGDYKLRVYAEGMQDTSEFDFEVEWTDMPLALRNPSYAIEIMYYILTDEEFDKMRSGTDQEKSAKLMKYWKEKDPTKSTPFNENMTEYFRRVDYAFFNFQTLKEKDGAKSERGKIYILHGKPEKIEKVLSNGKQFELWTYSRLKKIFHFELISNGLYYLTKIEDIK